jgi:hypothetical protein
MDIPRAFDLAAKTLVLLVSSVSLTLGCYVLLGKYNIRTPGMIVVLGLFRWDDAGDGCCDLRWAGWAFLVDFLCSVSLLVAVYTLFLRFRRKRARGS